MMSSCSSPAANSANSMLRVLLAKDLRRAWRNPLPWLINLLVPLAMTALLGMVFGGGGEGGSLGKVRFAVVNENHSRFSDFLRRAAGSLSQTNVSGLQLEPVFMDRTNALREINANQLSAVVIIPTNFGRDYLTARVPVQLELLKNPAESIHPAVIEEMLGVVVTAMNELSRNFHDDFPEWRSVFAGKDDYHQISFLIERVGDQLKSAEKIIKPPLVGYTKDETETASLAADGKKPAPAKRDELHATLRLFAGGLAAMFLLFLGQNAMTDLHREIRKRTFERYQTMHQDIWRFLVSKIIFAVVMLLICSVVMLGGGGLIFEIHWQHPLALLALAVGYAGFVAGLSATLVALVTDERRAAVLNNVAGMGIGIIGGCAFPARNLPAFLREQLTPLIPSNWFVETARHLQSGDPAAAGWGWVLCKLILGGVVLTALAAVLFRRKFKVGLRA